MGLYQQTSPYKKVTMCYQQRRNGDNMEAYSGFAEYYDTFMENIPYKKWHRYLRSLLQEYDVTEGLVLELGCGTGTMTELLAADGYDMIGIDQSADMLAEAMAKSGESERSILYLQQDMRQFELYGTVSAIVSICDTMNYILEKEDFVQVLKLANNYLDPDGIFIFDLKTEHYYKNIIGETIFAENRETESIIWENYYYEEEKINEYGVTIFAQAKDGRYDKIEEVHYQKAWDVETVKKMAEQAGFVWIAAYDAFTREPVKEDSIRIYIILKERGKR